MDAFRFCPCCATPLTPLVVQEDSGARERLRCPACGWTHWNNPTPVLAAVIEYRGGILLARNAAWTHRMYALITGFMEAGESPQEGIAREVQEETGLEVTALALIGVYDFQRMNQVIIAWHARCEGEVTLSPELAEWRLFRFDEVRCWRSGTGLALADFLRSRGHEPNYLDAPDGSSVRA